MGGISCHVTLCAGGSKAFAGHYILYCPASRAISRYCPRTRAISRYCPGRWLLASLWLNFWSSRWSIGYCNRKLHSLYSGSCNFYWWYWVFLFLIMISGFLECNTKVLSFIVANFNKQIKNHFEWVLNKACQHIIAEYLSVRYIIITLFSLHVYIYVCVCVTLRNADPKNR